MTPEQIRKQTAELVGTFFLCFIGAGAILADSLPNVSLGLLGIALAHGLALSIAVSATMNVSGGHINPAVTVTMWVVKNISGKDAIGYIIAQLLGGLIAGFSLLMIYRAMDADAAIQATHLGTPALGANVSPMLGVFIEAIVTFLLLFAIFGTAVDPRAPKIGGFGIGLTIAFDIMMAGPLTGAAMNPARAFATAVPARFFEAHWVYWIGPIIGGVLAGLVYSTVILPGAREEAS
jgi:MIP family channel proteins